MICKFYARNWAKNTEKVQKPGNIKIQNLEDIMKTTQKPKIIKMKVSDLKPASYNPRKISDRAMSGLSASIDRFGLVQPVIWNEKTGNVVGGHQRLKVLLSKGEIEADVVVVSLDPSEEKALNIALNNQHICGEWTEELEKLLAEIRESTPDAYDDLLLDALLSEIPEGELEETDADIDVIPEIQEEPVSKRGDMWTLGHHRLLCGDSTNAADFIRLMDGKNADMVFTDPPYGVSYCGTNNPNGKEWEVIEGDDLRGDDLFGLLSKSFKLVANHSKKTAAFYIFHAALNQSIFEEAIKEAGLKVKQQIIWAKHHVLGHSDYHWKHEPCFYCCFVNKNCDFYGDRTNTTLWEISKDASSNYIHPTQKPVDLARKAIENSSRYGKIILDPFTGSGSTMMACEITDRKFRGMEIDPRYCDAIVKRWETYTGQKAKLI